MKYIDAEKLKKEIEKLKTDFINFHHGIDLELVKSYFGYRAYDNVLSVIDTLQNDNSNELENWLLKQLKLSQKCMRLADRDWNRAYENGAVTAYASVLERIGQIPKDVEED